MEELRSQRPGDAFDLDTPQVESIQVKPVPAPQSIVPNFIGLWKIQVNDMVGSRLFVDFKPNGTFQMTQQVGMYQVSVAGNWGFNAQTLQLSLQGVVNTFQPFVLGMTLTNNIGDLYYFTGSDGIVYTMQPDNRMVKP